MIRRPINPFIWLTFQLLILCISSGLCTSNHLCDGDDGDWDVWGAENSYNIHCLQTNSHYRSFSTKSSGGPLVHELQRANAMWSLCEACQDWGGWSSVDWRPPEIVALNLNKTEILCYLYFRSLWIKLKHCHTRRGTVLILGWSSYNGYHYTYTTVTLYYRFLHLLES